MQRGFAPVPQFLYGTAWKEDRTQALVEVALRAGFRGIDTANQRRHYLEAGSGLALAAASRERWTAEDAEVWTAMVKERDAGRTRFLGVSNVGLRHLEQIEAAGAEAPSFVQNRCFARLGWDREVRAFCRDGGIVHQGFSLLTADAVRSIETLAG